MKSMQEVGVQLSAKHYLTGSVIVLMVAVVPLSLNPRPQVISSASSSGPTERATAVNLRAVFIRVRVYYAKPTAMNIAVSLLPGRWRWGEFESAGKESDQDALPFVIEKALYQQTDLLTAAGESLLPSDADAINLYFVGVAGFSRQDVFRKELDFIHAQFDQMYGTAGRSLVLINHNDTQTNIPMVTPYSIEQALQAVASKMNPDKDILFLYLTSHGSAKHEFSIDYPMGKRTRRRGYSFPATDGDG